MASTDIQFLVFVIVGFFAGLFFFVMGLLWFKKKRLLEDIPTSKVRSIAMGLVEVCGEATPFENNVLKGPFTNKDCVSYKVTVEKLVSSGKSSHWETIKTEEKGDYFYIQDDTGKVLVTTKGAERDIPFDFVLDTNSRNNMPEQVIQYIEANKIQTQDFFHFSYRMRYRESDIEISDKLFVCGTAGENLFQGNITENDVGHIMIQKGVEDKSFLISEHSKKEELKGLKTKSLLGILGGAALTVGCLFILILYFNLL